MEYAYPVDQAPANERAGFIRRTYGHLAGAILAFIGLEYVLLHIPGIERFAMMMMGGAWIVVLLAFMGVSYLADMWARSNTSPAMQYLGLGLYVVAEAVIFLPILVIAAFAVNPATGLPRYPNVIPMAGIMTLAVFGGLTLAVLLTGKDYSFLRPVITIGSFIALGVIIAGVLFGFHLGLFFCFAMVALASVAIIYQTSNVMHHFSTTQHVAAALALFAAVALLFWYILQIAMSSRD
jgi:FtsH-binding integral membrane protein